MAEDGAGWHSQSSPGGVVNRDTAQVGWACPGPNGGRSESSRTMQALEGNKGQAQYPQEYLHFLSTHCARHYSKWCTCTNSFNPHNPMSYQLVAIIISVL